MLDIINCYHSDGAAEASQRLPLISDVVIEVMCPTIGNSYYNLVKERKRY